MCRAKTRARVLVMNKSQLAEGYEWGNDLHLDDLRVGDEFSTPGSRRVAKTGGTITKISRVNIAYDSVYEMTGQTMHLKISKHELVGGKVLRGNTVHEVV